MPVSHLVARMDNITFEISAEEQEKRRPALITGVMRKSCNEVIIELFKGAKTLRNSLHVTFTENTSYYKSLLGGGSKFFKALTKMTGFRKVLIDVLPDEKWFREGHIHDQLESSLGSAELVCSANSGFQVVFYSRPRAAEILKGKARVMLQEADRLTG